MAESAALAQFNKSWAELSDWLAMLDNMVHNKRVVVADVDDINDNIALLKVPLAYEIDFFLFLFCSAFPTCLLSKLLWSSNVDTSILC